MRSLQRRRRRRAAWLLVLACLPVMPGFGLGRNNDVPTGFGEYFYTASAFQAPDLPPLRSAPEAAEWERRILEQEWRQGPYGPDVSETLLDAGNYFYGRGDYRSAIAHWRRAVHLIRVNNGLYSELQLPTLQRLYQTYMDIGDIEGADQVQDYLFFLHGQHHEPGDPEYIEALVTWVDWQRSQWLRSPSPEDSERLLNVWRLLERQTREPDEILLSVQQLEPLVYAKMRLLYVVGASDFGLSREAESLIGRQYGGAAAEPDFERSRIQALQEAAYSRGRQRLEELDERLVAGGYQQRRARLHRELGDWHLWHGQYKRATDAYAESWRLLGEVGELDTREQWYSQPVALPADGVLWVGTPVDADLSESSVIDVQFDVSHRGLPRNVDARARAPEYEGSAVRLHRMLRDTRFRPRLEAGEPVETSGLARAYRLN